MNSGTLRRVTPPETHTEGAVIIVKFGVEAQFHINLPPWSTGYPALITFLRTNFLLTVRGNEPQVLTTEIFKSGRPLYTYAFVTLRMPVLNLFWRALNINLVPGISELCDE